MAPRITSSATRSRRQQASRAVVRSSAGRSNRQNVSNARVTTQRSGVSGTARDRVTTSNSGSRVTTGDNRPTGSGGTARVTSSQQRGLRARTAQSTGTGGARATGTGARPANQPRGGAPVTQGRGGTQNRPNNLSIGSASRLSAVAAGLQAYNSGDSTMAAARNRGDLRSRRQSTAQEQASNSAAERKAREANARRNRTYNSSASGFDDAFRSAKKAGVKTFTWNGKQYSTETK